MRPGVDGFTKLSAILLRAKLKKLCSFRQKGVGGFFVGHGGGGPVAGINNRPSGQGEDLFPDAGEKLSAVAAGEIPAAHAFGKEDIPAVQLPGTGKIKTEAARAVSGNEEQPGNSPGRRDGAGLFQELGGRDGAETLEQAEAKHGVGLEAEKSGIGMIINGATGPVGQVGGVPDVVPVAVGEEEGVGLDFFLFQKVEEALRCVDGEPVAAKIDQVGVGGGEAAGVGQGLRHQDSYLKRFVSVDDYV